MPMHIRTLSKKGETFYKGNHCIKSVLLACSMDGSEKLPFYAKRKYVNPCCFKNSEALSVRYESTAKARKNENLF